MVCLGGAWAILGLIWIAGKSYIRIEVMTGKLITEESDFVRDQI
jgi:hypothetical protein